MAEIEVWGVDQHGGRVSTLRVRFKGTAERAVDRATALRWLAEGHSMILYSGSAHHGHRGASIERVEVDEEAYLRTDMVTEARDHVAVAHTEAH